MGVTLPRPSRHRPNIDRVYAKSLMHINLLQKLFKKLLNRFPVEKIKLAYIYINKQIYNIYDG